MPRRNLNDENNVEEGKEITLNEEEDGEIIAISNNNEEEEEEKSSSSWEILSDKLSLSSSHTSAILIASRGSASIGSFGSSAGGNYDNNSHNNNKLGLTKNTFLLPPHAHTNNTLQRSTSSSTLASEDCTAISNNNNNGRCHVYGTPGIDYVEHVVLPTDTLQGICISYKISATRLRQTNQFSGSTLLLAPKKLIIPVKNKAGAAGIKVQDRSTREYKLCALVAEIPDLKADEAKSYLNRSNWNLEEAICMAKEDGEWEEDEDETSNTAIIPSRFVSDDEDDNNNNNNNNNNIYANTKGEKIRVTLRVHKGLPISAVTKVWGSGSRRMRRKDASMTKNRVQQQQQHLEGVSDSLNVLDTTILTNSDDDNDHDVDDADCVDVVSATDKTNDIVAATTTTSTATTNQLPKPVSSNKISPTALTPADVCKAAPFNEEDGFEMKDLVGGTNAKV